MAVVQAHCAPAPNLFIAIPCYQGVVSCETASSLVEAVSHLRKEGLKVSINFHIGSCYIETARNDLVHDFLNSGYDDLLFWDADVGVLPDTVLRLAKSTRPFVAAIYPKKEADDSLKFPIEFLPGERWADDEGLVEVKMVPTGMLRLNRSVFDAIKSREYTNNQGRKQRAYFRNDIRDTFYGEDVEFCRKWRHVGGKIFIIPDAMLAHFGFKSWRANVGDSMKAGYI